MITLLITTRVHGQDGKVVALTSLIHETDPNSASRAKNSAKDHNQKLGKGSDSTIDIVELGDSN